MTDHAAPGSRPKLSLKPITWRAACDYINQHHRHHISPQGYKFAIGSCDGDRLCGVVIVGRPVSRKLDDGLTAEVTRLATDGTPNACSCLYGAAARTAKAMGYRAVITYILADEPGTSLRAAGWKCEGNTEGGSWDVPSRPRADKHPTGPKQRWRKPL